MNTAYKSNLYLLKPLDNGITKSRSKKEILLDKLSKAIRHAFTGRRRDDPHRTGTSRA